MVAAHPGCENRGSATNEFVYLHDLFPTFLEMADLTPPDVPDSHSILPNILGRETPTGRDSIYSAFYSQIFPFEQRMIRTATHKFVFNRSDIGELYDMVQDPWELRNLIDLPETADTQRELMAQMREHMERLDDPILRFYDTLSPVY
jgi:arylsulfatase A-like enzyme